MSLNLHKVVRGAINAVHPDEEVQILHSLGSTPDENGFAAPNFIEGLMKAVKKH